MNSSTSVRFPALQLSPNLEAVRPRINSSQTCSSDCDDEDLIARVQIGDREALALLFRRYARPVRNVGQRIIRDKAEADDLVQEVFLYIQRKSALFDGSKGSARSWIVQVAYTQALLRRRQLKALGFYLPRISDHQFDCSQPADGEAHYDRTVEALLGRNRWKQILQGLTRDQRQTLRLHFFEGYTFAEIAERLGQSHANIRNHHYRALEKVRKYLTSDDSTGR